MSIPNLYGLVLRTCNKKSLVKFQIQHRLSVSISELLYHFPCRETPKDDVRVTTARYYNVLFLSVVKLQAQDRASVAFQRFPDKTLCIYVPDPQRTVTTPTH